MYTLTFNSEIGKSVYSCHNYFIVVNTSSPEFKFHSYAQL
jgi:hypothetical protein